MMKKLYAHVLLDRSGSMENCRDATIDAFNEFVNSLAVDDKVSTRVSLTTFDSESIDLVVESVKAKDCPKLTRKTFEPRACTPLNDAIGRTVASIDAGKRREGENVAFAILTDGLENASREYSTDAVRELLDGRQKDKNWLVIYLGANQDAFAEGAARGSAAAHSMAFSTDNVAHAMRAVSRSSLAYGSTGLREGAEFTDDERRLAAGKSRKRKQRGASPIKPAD